MKTKTYFVRGVSFRIHPKATHQEMMEAALAHCHVLFDKVTAFTLSDVKLIGKQVEKGIVPVERLRCAVEGYLDMSHSGAELDVWREMLLCKLKLVN